MEIVSIAVSKKKGTRKTQVEEASIIAEHGVEGEEIYLGIIRDNEELRMKN